MRLLFDEDLNHNIIRGLVRRIEALDYKTVLDLGLEGREDAEVLEAAASEHRLLVSHDVTSMTVAFRGRAAEASPSFGLVLVPQSLPLGDAIDQLELICVASTNDDWLGVIEFLPI